MSIDVEDLVHCNFYSRMENLHFVSQWRVHFIWLVCLSNLHVSLGLHFSRPQYVPVADEAVKIAIVIQPLMQTIRVKEKYSQDPLKLVSCFGSTQDLVLHKFGQHKPLPEHS